MTTLTAKKIHDLNNMNAAAQRAQLGTLIMGGAVIPSVGTLTTINTLRYSVAPTVKSATATMSATALTSGAQAGFTTGLHQPDVTRTVTVKGNASGISGNVVIHGKDIAGTVVSDTIALSGASEVLGLVAFKSISSVDFPAETHAGTDTVSLGRGAGIGFPSIIDNTAKVLSHDFDGANDTGTVVADATIGKSVFIVAGTMDGTKLVELVFLTD